MNRRELLASIGFGSFAAYSGFAYAQRRIPFCCFSLTSGWSDRGGGKILAKEVRNDDPSGIPKVVSRIEQALHFSSKIEVLIVKGKEENAFATVADGRRLLVIDEGFLRGANRKAESDWAAVEIIAHEVGHHIAGFVDDPYACELNADYWSGQTLQRLGSDEAAAKSAILAVGNETDTPSHPNKFARAAVVSAGWQDSKNNVVDYSRCTRCRA
jgi:hypothetical protein